MVKTVKNKPKLITAIQLIILISVLSLSLFFIIFQIFYKVNSLNRQSIRIRNDYIETQKLLIHDEVTRVSNMIDIRIKSTEKLVRKNTKDRVYEAYAVVENIYNENVETKTYSEIEKMVQDALRPIIFESNSGYYFITSYSGVQTLFADKPELEGKNLLYMQDYMGTYIVKDFIEISKKNGEGFSEYYWTRPNIEGNHHKKISYTKLFKPYNWIIGTGLYVEDIEENIKEQLLVNISNIRFGKEGYIFVNTLDGDALVTHGKVIEENKKLWDIFNEDVGEIKEIFDKERIAALKPSGDYIYYNIAKLSSSEVESPKSSFILGIPKFNWLIGAGVYLDDIEVEIGILQEKSQKELRIHIRNAVIVISLVTIFVLLLVSLLGHKLKNDFQLFITFFKQESQNDIKINLNAVKFNELYLLAKEANKMQSEKVMVQLKLKDNESKFRLLAENSKDLIFRMSLPDGNYDYVSPASIDILGYTPKEIIDNPSYIKESIHPDWKEWYTEKLRLLNIGLTDEFYEYQIINKNDETIWINQKNNLIKDDNGNAIALVGRLSNDTERKQIEIQLRQNYRMDAIGQIAGGIAHDFNNILGGIMNAAQVLQSPKRNMDERGAQMVSLIKKSALRASNLTGKLSSFSRKRSVLLKPIDIHNIVDETLDLLSETINNNIKITTTQNASKHIIRGDSIEIQSIIMNLVINASHAIENDGTITIITENRNLDKKFTNSSNFNISSGNYIEIEVRDSGSGIKKENLDQIFVPFFSTKEQGKGTGLGLATVYGAILDHHGAINVTSKLGRGSSFFILLPTTEESIQEKKTDSKTLEGKGSILVVDDEEMIRTTSEQLLKDIGYSVILAKDGEEAVTIYREKGNTIDIVLMDMMMPKMNGREAFQQIKKIDSKCKVIIASGYTKNEDINELKKSGLSGFIRKPFSATELNSKIRTIIYDS